MATVSTGVVGDASVGIDMGDGTEDTTAISNDGQGIINEPGEFDEDGDDEGGSIDTGATGDDPGSADDDGEALEDLGEYSDENLEAYDTRYRTEAGGPNLAVLSREWDQNAASAEGGTGHLNEGTYQYLQDTFGLSKEEVQDIEAGQVAKRQVYFTQVAQAAGGNKALSDMVAWGKENYSPQARKRFNEAYRSGDVERATEAVEALASRFNKAHGRGVRRPTNPVRSVTKNASGPGGAGAQGFETRDAWMSARKEAKGDRRKEAEVAKKFRASNRRKWDS